MISEPLKRHVSSAGFLTMLVFVLTSCVPAQKDAPIGVDARTAEVIKSSKVPYSQALAETVDRVKTGAEDEDRVKIFKGSGIMVKGQTPWEPMAPVTVTPPARSATPPAATAQPMQPTPPPPAGSAIPPTVTPPPATTQPTPTPPVTTTPPPPPAGSAIPPTVPPPSTTPPPTPPVKSGSDTTPPATATPTPPAEGVAPPATAQPTSPTPTTRASRRARSGATPPVPVTPTTPPPTSATQPTTQPAPATPTPPAGSTPTPPAGSTPTPPTAQPVPPTAQPVPPAPVTPPVPPPPMPPSARGGGNIVLNFEAADLREVIRNILGDILGEAYLIDPSVNGQVTIRTSSGIPRDSLYATLETLLRMNNATMTKEEGIYKILPAAVGFKGNVTPQLGSSQRPLPKGFSVQIVPLRYVSAKEMLKILEPFAKEAQAVRTDDTRNLIILSGTELELRHLLDTIEMFDINWMSGMSVGFFKLKNVEVKSLAQDLQSAIGGEATGMGLMLGAMKFIPIERMNMLLVVTPQPDQLSEVKKWIDRFDEEDNMETPRLYVYALKYARADKLAPLLQQAFTGKNTGPTRIQPATTAPGTTGVTMGGARPLGSTTGASQGIQRTPATGTQRQTTPTGTVARPGTAAAGTVAGRPGAVVARPGTMSTGSAGMGIAQDIQVVADEDNNAILIVATPGEYTLVEQALKKLDVPQRQVVIEVTMAEVTLKDSLSFGTKWWFTSGYDPLAAPGNRGNYTYGGYGSAKPPADMSSLAGSAFNLIINPRQLMAFFEASDNTSNVKVVANPHIAALDNQEATIEVTNQTPYQNSYNNYYGGYNPPTEPNNTGNYPYSNTTWEYVETGVYVTVKPHINEGGNVSMEADIRISAAGDAPAIGARPPVVNRQMSSQLMVPSGSTMVIGGLIRDDRASGSDGVPYLSRVPVLGALFGKQNWSNQRTELVIFLTPRVVESEESRRAIIQDLRYRMDNLEGLLKESKALPTDLLRREILLEQPDENEQRL